MMQQPLLGWGHGGAKTLILGASQLLTGDAAHLRRPALSYGGQLWWQEIKSWDIFERSAEMDFIR